MQCSTEEVVIEDVEERLDSEGLYWTVRKMCESNPPAITGPGLDYIESGSAFFVRQYILEEPDGAVSWAAGKVQLPRMIFGSRLLCIAALGWSPCVMPSGKFMDHDIYYEPHDFRTWGSVET